MIAYLSGTLIQRTEKSVVIETNGLGYEVLLPHIVSKALEAHPLGEPLALETIYYFALEQTRATPILIGFQNSIEKEFFERLVTVPKIGPRAALNAFASPVSSIARAIETADHKSLEALPGIGKQKARDLVAALQGKVAKFALMQDADLERQLGMPAPEHNVIAEATQLLVMLGHKLADAERLVQEALIAEPQSTDAESVVRVIYRKQQEKK